MASGQEGLRLLFMDTEEGGQCLYPQQNLPVCFVNSAVTPTALSCAGRCPGAGFQQGPVPALVQLTGSSESQTMSKRSQEN